jgi:hypothetical protein
MPGNRRLVALEERAYLVQREPNGLRVDAHIDLNLAVWRYESDDVLNGHATSYWHRSLLS